MTLKSSRSRRWGHEGMFVITSHGPRTDPIDEVVAICDACDRPLVDNHDVIAFAAPAQKSYSSIYLVHRKCVDHRLVALVGTGFRMLRIGEALKKLIVRLTV
jgi:hypothetical protein